MAEPTNPQTTVVAETLEESRQLTASYEKALSAKNEEFEALRAVFEKLREHIIRLQLNITELRQERHRLADAAMRADAAERKCEQLTMERDALRTQLENLTWKG